MLNPDSVTSLLIHFHKTKTQVVREMNAELHASYLKALKAWLADPKISVIGDTVMAEMMSRMGCEIELYEQDPPSYFIWMPHSELM